MNLGKKFTSNLAIALLAQLFSFILSVLLSLIAPKIINDVVEFGYWQLFLFYCNYVSLGQLGLVDGIYLNKGGKEWEKLDFSSIKTQFEIFTVLQLIISAFIIGSACLFFDDVNRKIILCSVAAYLILYNCSRFWGLLFQAVNRTKLFSVCSIVDRLVVIVLAVPLLFGGNIRYFFIRNSLCLSFYVCECQKCLKCQKSVFSKSKKRTV